MKSILTLILLLCISNSFSQVLHHVEVGGTPNSSTPDPYFSPQHITINVGDTVRWTNVEGWHSIDGSQASFSSNPASFSSGSAGSGWVYEFVFTVPGVYDYNCPVGSHALTQFGTVTVNGANNIFDNSNELNVSIQLYGSDQLILLSGTKHTDSYMISDLSGRLCMSGECSNGETRVKYNNITQGIYLISVTSKQGATSKKIRIE